MKIRLDQYLVDTCRAPDMVTARALIGAGEVYVDEKVVDKVGTLINHSAFVRVKERCRYASRGGLKLAKALLDFNIDVTDYICLDIGASTGGFTDCLLQNGAQKVYAIDVAYGQLAWKLRQDPRVVPIERFNARNLNLGVIDYDIVDFAAMDVSFISLTKVLPAVISTFKRHVNIISLIKPQFELPRDDISPGGVVTDNLLHEKAIAKIEHFLQQVNCCSGGVIKSPLLGPKGNTEFLIHITSC